MNTKHTPEPWERVHGIIVQSPFQKIPNGTRSLTICRTDNPRMGEQEEGANAKRIVDCVNACAGMDDPAKEIASLKETNADLLAALESFLRAPSVGSDGPGSHTIVVQGFNRRAAQAAITKAKGESHDR